MNTQTNTNTTRQDAAKRERNLQAQAEFKFSKLPPEARRQIYGVVLGLWLIEQVEQWKRAEKH